MVKEFKEKLQQAIDNMTKVELHIQIPNSCNMSLCSCIDELFLDSATGDAVICMGNTEIRFNMGCDISIDDEYYILHINGGKVYVCFY